jgi:hypothetical protein
MVETVDALRADLESGIPAFGAWLGPRLAGSARGRPYGARMEVSRLSVAPDLHGPGFGRCVRWMGAEVRLGLVVVVAVAGCRSNSDHGVPPDGVGAHWQV